MKTLQTLTAILVISAMPFLGTGCANWTPAQSADATSALVALGTAAVSYASGNIPGTAVNALSAASYALRTIQGTPSAATPTAIATAMTTTAQALSAASVAPTVGAKTNPVITKTIAVVNAAAAAGATPNQANEAAALALDAAVTQIQAPGPRGDLGRIGVAGRVQ